MGIVIAGLAVITMLLVASSVMFSTFLDGSVSGAQSLKILTQANVKRIGSAVSLNGGTFYTTGTTGLSVNADNSGSQLVARFGEMDVIVKYTDESDLAVLTRLSYVSSGIDANQWTLSSTGVTPNVFNPGNWDSDETLFIDLQVDPAVKSGTSALVVVGTPWAVADQIFVAAP
ncbi:MAG: hypothetical protein BZY75_06345 [SAR202 cluster bacterium Io17-Chloro-G7]|nr:MAG: hypothetical protein BZY75_06345 [SAR202 cluster bacterium Io17-Chloro-G7]